MDRRDHWVVGTSVLVVGEGMLSLVRTLVAGVVRNPGVESNPVVGSSPVLALPTHPERQVVAALLVAH